VLESKKNSKELKSILMNAPCFQNHVRRSLQGKRILVDTINRLINSKKPEVLILESGKCCGLCNQSRMNQKTYWIAQNLASDGWRINRLKHYKGKSLKVILSSK